MIDRFEGENRFLSNFYPSPVMYRGIVYPSVECAFQAAQLTAAQAKFAQLTAAQAKSHGRRVKLREDWESVKLEIMEILLRRKFKDSTLRAKLLATGQEQLIEGNWWHDTFWGVCNGVGENHLGRLLMRVRDEIRVDGR